MTKRSHSATIEDDRTANSRRTHTVLVVGTDSFMSGWGLAPGRSYAAWACRPEDQYRVYRWVRSRSEMKRVRVVGCDYRPRLGSGDHLHIYVVNDGHAALS